IRRPVFLLGKLVPKRQPVIENTDGEVYTPLLTLAFGQFDDHTVVSISCCFYLTDYQIVVLVDFFILAVNDSKRSPEARLIFKHQTKLRVLDKHFTLICYLV